MTAADNVRSILAMTPAGASVDITPEVPPTPEQHDDDTPSYADYLRSRMLSGDAVLTRPRTSWMVKGWVPNRSVGALYAPPGVGKSFYALTFALEVARGGWWCGQQLEAADVLYVIGERPEVITDRQEAWRLFHGQPIPDTFHDLSAAPQLVNGLHLEGLLENVRDLRPRLVVLDTLASLTLGVAENDGKEWGKVVEALGYIRDATDGGSVLAVHHTGKDAAKGLRGHTVFLGAVDFTLEMTGDAGAVRVRVDKLNAAAKPMPLWYKVEPITLPPIGEDPDPRDGGVLVTTTGKSAGESRSTDLLVLLGTTYADTGMSRSDAEAALGVSRSLAAEALKHAKDSGWARVEGKGPGTRYYITPDGAAVVADLT